MTTTENTTKPNGAIDTGRRLDLGHMKPGRSSTMVRHHAVREVVIEPQKKQKRHQPKEPENEVLVQEKVESRVAVAKPEPAAIIRPNPVEWDESGDFAQMLEEGGPIESLRLQVGQRVSAKLIHRAKDTAFFALGKKQEAFMLASELLDENGEMKVHPGDVVDAYVVSLENGIELSKKAGRNMLDVSALEGAQSSGIPVEGKVLSVNQGGLEVALAGVRAFCPIGQADIHYVEDPSQLVGKTLAFLVKQVQNGGRNVVLSRRALLERERGEASRRTLATLNVGDRVTGQVSRTMPFGAFVDLGGIEGLIPMSELSFGHRASVEEVVHVGDQVTVDVRSIEPDPKREGQMRISLSLKSAMPNPWDTYGHELVPGASLEGKVARLEGFGAFVELFPGIDGMIHVSELSEQRVRHPSEVLKIGDAITVRVLEVDPEKRRIALSLRENVERTHTEAKAAPGLKRGDKREGVVERVERYGVFLRLDSGQTALLPGAETDQPKGADLARAYPIGTRIAVLVIDIDDRNRVRVSITALEKAEERELVETYSKASTKSQGFGKLGDLLKNRKG